MATRIEANAVGVNTVGTFYWPIANDDPVKIYNSGSNTVYIGPLDPTSPVSAVSTTSGFPLFPGETIDVPNPGGSDYRIGFITASGATQLLVLGTS